MWMMTASSTVAQMMPNPQLTVVKLDYPTESTGWRDTYAGEAGEK